MQIQTGSQTFAKFKGSGPRTALITVSFPTAVSKATAILTGFVAGFSARSDHHLGKLQIEVTVAPDAGGTSIPVTVKFGVRDWSGEFDDNYEGTVHFAVIGE